MLKVGIDLKQIVLKRGFRSVSDFCNQCGIARSLFYNVINYKHVSVNTEYCIANALNMEVEELFE